MSNIFQGLTLGSETSVSSMTIKIKYLDSNFCFAFLKHSFVHRTKTASTNQVGRGEAINSFLEAFGKTPREICRNQLKCIPFLPSSVSIESTKKLMQKWFQESPRVERLSTSFQGPILPCWNVEVCILGNEIRNAPAKFTSSFDWCGSGILEDSINWYNTLGIVIR